MCYQGSEGALRRGEKNESQSVRTVVSCKCIVTLNAFRDDDSPHARDLRILSDSRQEILVSVGVLLFVICFLPATFIALRVSCHKKKKNSCADVK
jgi:hypothetical protein